MHYTIIYTGITIKNKLDNIIRGGIMSLYVIASIKDAMGCKLYRILNSNTYSIADIHERDIVRYIRDMGEIRNICVSSNGEVKWTQGTADRYPTINTSNQSILNENTAVVISMLGESDNRKYIVAFYNGKTAMVDSTRLIQYGESYGLANCKITSKGGKKFIAAISGSIDELPSKLEFKMNLNTKELTIFMPFDAGDTLEIPPMINGLLLEDIEKIQVIPDILALRVKKLIIPKHVKNIRSGQLKSFKNLEYIDIKSNEAALYDRAFTLNTKLKRIHVCGVYALGEAICHGLPNLEEFTTDRQLLFINRYDFSNLPKFNIASVLGEGLMDIKEGAFDGTVINTENGELVLPSTLNYIYRTSFRNNKGLKTIYIKSNKLSVLGSSRNKGLFHNSGNPVCYISNYSSIDIERIDSSVKIIRQESEEEKKIAKRIIPKAQIMGVDLEMHKIIDRNTQLGDALLVMSQDKLRNEIIRCIKSMIDLRTNSITEKLDIDNFKFFIRIKLPSGVSAIKDIKVTDKYIAILSRKIFMIPYDKKMLSNYIKRAKTDYYWSREMYIGAIAINRQGLKSLDIAENGSIRAIYRYSDGTHKSLEYDQYAIKMG